MADALLEAGKLDLHVHVVSQLFSLKELEVVKTS